MEELIARVTTVTGLDAATAQTAIGHILAFLQKEGPATEVSQLLATLPGSETTIAESNAGEGGGGLMGMLGGMMGGGVMALGQKLMAAGVPMGQMQPLGRELFAYGREKAGEDVMGPIVGSIPGLNQFV
ncbi:hypothetical protein ASG60_01055 [Methylobacterium sp. Leaf469]|jgi:hypothetical protein|uniref:hypothetical protein n=1 Tax=unclassified Methylobacterium TaxID=2615210 RepID=UPI0006F2F998|nr:MULTISPECIES: hypothetical protein [unclassified Methylobacterium]USU33302.1 DUF2267 domain-containing protein [Methylobacterium sp. OTU13CASTA1]KQO62038.1 hypothetical protein ASF22_06160 [Methylobacterium sp. Leaf87]KQP34183.1 hypothetical protein ASF27_01020 [Methylobacterium sp. Leaf102]KQP36576.1 hypothetical protein ASF25_01010 [Methylobacterium sp. Leaf100]KQP62079.1 hypothetical protein ASF52_05275 [Methylobacterium sp. Leaf112]